MQHHDDMLGTFAGETRQDDDAQALVLVGSVATGTERPDSDVDVYLVVSDDAFERAREADRLSYVRDDLATHDGGYVDVKLASPAYLDAASARGSEPARASFVGARVVWTQLPRLAEQLRAIPLLPESEWERRRDSFAAQMRLQAGYFLPQGAALADPFLLRWAGVHLVTAASRALLAQHRVLYRGPKYLRASVHALPDLPQGLAARLDELLEHPDPDLGFEVLVAVERHVRSPLGQDETLSRFVGDDELAWLWQVPAPEQY